MLKIEEKVVETVTMTKEDRSRLAITLLAAGSWLKTVEYKAEDGENPFADEETRKMLLAICDQLLRSADELNSLVAVSNTVTTMVEA